MRRFHILLPFLITMISAPAYAQLSLGQGATIGFATVKEAKEVLERRDDFVQRMSPFDRAVRMKTDRDVSEEEYLRFVGRNVLAWDEADKQKITVAYRGVEKRLAVQNLPFPKKVLLIKTTGNEEGGAAYTAPTLLSFRKTICQSRWRR